MAVIDTLRHACWLVILALAFLPGIAISGDEDSGPGYMIYIDPETGKYTTEDPHAGKGSGPVVSSESAAAAAQPEFPTLIVGAVALAVLLGGGLLRLQRKQQLRQS